MSPFLYLRGLKHVDFSVFGVQDGQKAYRDPSTRKLQPYSSGQQVKRSIMERFLEQLEAKPAEITFVSVVTSKKDKATLGEGEPLSLCDPSYPDQLIGGYMRAESGGEKRTLKRRSPLSISAMRPLHPSLAELHSENITYDRSDRPELHRVIVRNADGVPLAQAEIDTLLKGTDRSLLRKWIPDNKRAGGFFVYDVAIDLRRLFTVQTNQYEPEISEATLASLKEKGWTEGENVFGKCLIAPQPEREKMARALAHALLHWQITSNQSRTFSLMETLAVAISDNASRLAGAIRTKLPEEGQQVSIVVEEALDQVETFITLAAGGYIRTQVEAADALDRAEASLAEKILAYSATL